MERHKGKRDRKQVKQRRETKVEDVELSEELGATKEREAEAARARARKMQKYNGL